MNQYTEQLLREIKIDWNQIEESSYLRKIASLSNLESLSFVSPVTFFVGENGSGKSTLLEAIAIACGFNPEGGTKNYLFSTYDSHSELVHAMSLVRGSRKEEWGFFLRAESFYNVASVEEQYGEEVNRSLYLHKQSHGESFLKMLQAQIQKNGLYLFDEPEAALSPQRQLSLLVEIHEAVKEGCQFIIATHSPIILGYPDAQILSFDEKLRPILYEETESYQTTKLFLEQRQSLLAHLLKNK